MRFEIVEKQDIFPLTNKNIILYTRHYHNIKIKQNFIRL